MYKVEFRFVFQYPMEDRKTLYSVFSKKAELPFVPLEGLGIRFSCSGLTRVFYIEDAVFNMKNKKFEASLAELTVLNKTDLPKIKSFLKDWIESEKTHKNLLCSRRSGNRRFLFG